MATRRQEYIARIIAEQAKPLHRTAADGFEKQGYDDLLSSIGDQVQVVMIGEASHGTHEYYQCRAEITKRLIEEKGFNMVCCEADWPDMTRVNRYVMPHSVGFFEHRSQDRNADEALGDFQRFPRWMWRNTVMVEFVEWLKQHNARIAAQQEGNGPLHVTGMYGLDVYSLQASMDAVIEYLDQVDPAAAKQARKAYSCFDKFGQNKSKGYAKQVGLGLAESCERKTIDVLLRLLAKTSDYIQRDHGSIGLFYAQQNALIVKNAENYYRNMLNTGVNTWNIRDSHMCDTLINLMQWNPHNGGGATSSASSYDEDDELPIPGEAPDMSLPGETQHVPRKAVIWAHNSHLGDARFTYMRSKKKHNIGQLVREHFGMDRTFSIGFTSYSGSVTAADEWGEDCRFKIVNKAMKGSVEELMHEAVVQKMRCMPQDSGASSSDDRPTSDMKLIFRGNNPKWHGTIPSLVSKELRDLLFNERLERAIGVIYRPETERWSHMFESRVSSQFDCLLHLDATRALRPLETHPQWVEVTKVHHDDIPDTFPFAI